MNIRTALFSIGLLTSFATSASAVEHAVIGSSTITVVSGETFTLNIAIDNVSASEVTGITGVLSGLNGVGGTVVGGQATLVNFATLCGPFGPGGSVICLGGINTISNPNYDPNDLSAGSLTGNSRYQPGNDFVNTIAALHAPPTFSFGDGAVDPGVAGVLGTFDATDLSIDLTATTTGVIMVDMVFTEPGLSTDLTPLAITINVPEPGAMASSAVALSSVMAVVGLRRRKQEAQ